MKDEKGGVLRPTGMLRDVAYGVFTCVPVYLFTCRCGSRGIL